MNRWINHLITTVFGEEHLAMAGLLKTGSYSWQWLSCAVKQSRLGQTKTFGHIFPRVNWENIVSRQDSLLCCNEVFWWMIKIRLYWVTRVPARLLNPRGSGVMQSTVRGRLPGEQKVTCILSFIFFFLHNGVLGGYIKLIFLCGIPQT